MIGKNAGFSLYELMTVIGIIAVLSAIAVPGIIGWLPKHRVSVAARDVKSALEYTRLTAVRQSNNATLNFDFNNEQISIVDAVGTTIRNVQMPPDVDLASVSLGNPVQFDDKGISTSFGKVQVKNTRDASISRVIELTASGNARILPN